MIIQHEGKLKIKDIENISSEGDVLNNFYYTPKYPTLNLWWAKEIKPLDPQGDLAGQLEINHRIHGFEIARLLGTPNCHMQGYESYPGAWVFYDTEYNIRWLVFSDGIRKNHFKGTSYEVTLPENGITEDDFKAAIRKFFSHFNCIPLDKNKQPI